MNRIMLSCAAVFLVVSQAFAGGTVETTESAQTIEISTRFQFTGDVEA